MISSSVSYQKFDITVLRYILHSHSECWTVNQLEDVLLKIILGFCSQFCVYINELVQPCFLNEFVYPMSFFLALPRDQVPGSELLWIWNNFFSNRWHTSFSQSWTFIFLSRNGLTSTSRMYPMSPSSL